MDRLRREQLRVIDDLDSRSDAERRSWLFTTQLTIANVALAIAPFVPEAKRVFGALTGELAIGVVVPCFAPVFVSLVLYLRLGAKSRWYQCAEIVETVSLYSIALTLIVISGVRWSVLWALCPFSAIFFALTKPFRRSVYTVVICASHGAVAIVLVALERAGDAAVALGVGAISLTAFSVIARSQRSAVLAEADRNVARAELVDRQLDEERDRIAGSLASGVAEELSSLVEDLRVAALTQATKQAEAALLELNAITSTTRASTLPRSVDELGQLLERKLKALCVNTRYTQELAGDGAAAIAPATALAILRIGQELVRNAVTHGTARAVAVELAQLGREVSLSVTDDGSGLRDERFANATGGLDNVRRWLSECGGRLQRSSPGDKSSGTVLRVAMPLEP